MSPHEILLKSGGLVIMTQNTTHRMCHDPGFLYVLVELMRWCNQKICTFVSVHHPLGPRCLFLTVWISHSPSSASAVVSSSGMWWVCGSESQPRFHRNQRQSEAAAVHQWKRHLWDAHVPRRPVCARKLQRLQTDHLPHPWLQAHGISSDVAVQHYKAAAGQERHESHSGGLELRSCQCQLFKSSEKHTHSGWQPHRFCWQAEGARVTNSSGQPWPDDVECHNPLGIMERRLCCCFLSSFRKMVFLWAPFTWSESVLELTYQGLLVPVWMDP